MLAFVRFVLPALILLLAATKASAVTVPFDLTRFLLSTTTTSGVNLTADPVSAPALPPDTTFTIPADATVVLPPNPSNTYLSANQGKFLRFSFDLPSGFYDLAFTFEALVNDEYVLYVNDTVVAIQASTGTDNFVAPLPGFVLSATGTASDGSGKLEYLRASGMQPLFRAGTNELTLFGTDTLLWGGISAINGSVTAVPEPKAYAMLLVGIGLIALACSRRRRVRGVR